MSLIIVYGVKQYFMPSSLAVVTVHGPVSFRRRLERRHPANPLRSAAFNCQHRLQHQKVSGSDSVTAFSPIIATAVGQLATFIKTLDLEYLNRLSVGNRAGEQSHSSGHVTAAYQPRRESA